MSQDIKLTQSDGEFRRNTQAQSWLNRFTIYASDYLGINPTLRFGAYLHGFGTFVAIDLWSEDKNRSMSITVGISSNEVFLPATFDDQMDLRLPGMVDLLWFVSILVNATNAHVNVVGEL